MVDGVQLQDSLTEVQILTQQRHEHHGPEGLRPSDDGSARSHFQQCEGGGSPTPPVDHVWSLHHAVLIPKEYQIFLILQHDGGFLELGFLNRSSLFYVSVTSEKSCFRLLDQVLNAGGSRTFDRKSAEFM